MKIKKLNKLNLKQIQKIEARNQKVNINSWEEEEFDVYPRKHANNQKFKGLDELQENSE